MRSSQTTKGTAATNLIPGAIQFQPCRERRVEACLDGSSVASEGGVLPLRQAESPAGR